MQTLPDPQPNATAEAVALTNNRRAMHEANGNKLTSLVLLEYVHIDADTAWSAAVGADTPNPGVSTRELAGGRGHIRQTVVCGEIPAGDYPIVSLA
jgi:hypothetical protein